MIFKIPFLPPSVNKIYGWNSTTKQQYLKKDARQFKDQCKLFIPPIDESFSQKLLNVDILFHGNWYYKNGSIKRHDGQNLTKVLFDAVFERIGIDDSHIFECSWKKVQDTDEYVMVTIEEVCNEQVDVESNGIAKEADKQ